MLSIFLLLFASGCAIHHYDARTGTEHVWGFGHLKMQAVPQAGEGSLVTNAVMAYAMSVRTLGLNFGTSSDFGGIAAGWNARSRVVIQQPDASFYVIWPTNQVWLPWDLGDYFNLRIGPDFPFTNSAVQAPRI